MLRLVILWIFLLTSAAAAAATVHDGQLDLSGATLDSKSKVDLSGTWRFYPKAFLEAADFQQGLPTSQPSILVSVPGEVAGIPGPDGQPLPNDVWGSFVLELRNIPEWVPELGIRLRGDTAYKVLLINPAQDQSSRVLAQAGLPGVRSQESIPQIIEQLGRFTAPVGPGPYYLVVHLSGFFYVKPSLWVAPTIGPVRVMERERDWIRLSECVIVGMLLIMTLYHASLFVHRREELSSLWLAGFCCLIMLRFVTTSGYLTAFLFPTSTADLFEMIRKVEFASVPISATCLLAYTCKTFGFARWDKRLKWNHVVVAAIIAAVIFTDATFFPDFLPVILVHTLFVSLSTLGMVIVSIRRRREGAWLALFGLLVVVLLGYHDIMIGLGHLKTPIFLMPYGMVALIFAQGQVIAKLFSSAFRTADHLSKHLAEEVERQTRDLLSMLDHIPQGVMSVVAPGVIDPDVSAHLREVLAIEDIAGQTLDQALLSRSTLSTDDRERILAALSSCLGETELAFELNSAQLPQEIRLKLGSSYKILQMTWNPVMDKHGVIVKILITCHDVTEVRRYEAEAMEQKQELAYIQELVNISAEKFAIFYDTSLRLLDENLRLLQLNRNRNFEILKILFVNMHTIKGAARSLSFVKLSNWVHEVEQSYAVLLKDPEQAWEQQKLLQDATKTRDELEYYRRVNEQKLGRVTEKAGMITVNREFLAEHTHMLKQLEHTSADTFSEALAVAVRQFENLAFQDSLQVFQDICGSAAKIAKDLGKAPPQVNITGDNYGLSFHAQQLLRKVFIHIIRNALDHGIETADERVKHGKKPEGTLSLNFVEVRNRLQITISDDGRGLALGKLERRALELGILSATDTAPINDLGELIFYPGLSTADTLSEVSGRGVGMDAVKSFMEEAGGSIRVVIDATHGRVDYCPFSLVISLPSTLYLSKSELATSAMPSAS